MCINAIPEASLSIEFIVLDVDAALGFSLMGARSDSPRWHWR
jgi:hypothetical protein